MALIKKAVVKSYDPAAHKATVQITGSLGVWLDAIRVATDIPAADVVAGRQCTVLFLDPANQDDAVVLTIQGALPSAGPGVTDHGALTGLADDDHPQYGALAQAETVTTLWTFNAGLRLAAGATGAIEDSGGTDRIVLNTTTPHLTLTGDARINSNAGIDSAPSTTPDVALNIAPNRAITGTEWRGVQVNPSLTLSGSSNIVYGLIGNANVTVPATTSAHTLYGLNFQANLVPAGASSDVGLAAAASVRPGIIAVGTGKSMTVTDMKSYEAQFLLTTVILATATITNLCGLHLRGGTLSNAQLTVTTVRQLAIDDIDGSSVGTAYLIEAGAAPDLRLEGRATWTPAANQTPLLLAEGATPTLRRVQWKDGASIGAGDKVMVLA